MSTPFVLSKETAISWGLAASIFGIIFASGVLFQRVNSLEERMMKYEADKAASIADRERLTRVEEKLIGLDKKFDLIFEGVQVSLTKTPTPAN